MEYATPDDSVKSGERVKRRDVDVYGVDWPYFDGFCHLRGEVRRFRMDRVLSIKLTEKSYEIPDNWDKQE